MTAVPMKWRAAVPVVALGTLMLAIAASAMRREPSLPTFGAVPAFALTDHRERPVTADGLRGRVWIADFIFTRCSGQCPMMSGRMRGLADALPGVELLSFTVDPEWDTSAVLRRYAAAYGDRPQWRFVTGARPALESLSRDGFHLAAADEDSSGGVPIRNASGTDGTGDEAAEAITHSGRLVLVDAHGVIRGYYDAYDEERMRQLVRDAAALLREAPRG